MERGREIQEGHRVVNCRWEMVSGRRVWRCFHVLCLSGHNTKKAKSAPCVWRIKYLKRHFGPDVGCGHVVLRRDDLKRGSLECFTTD